MFFCGYPLACARADTITQAQELTFGQFAIGGNSVVRSIVMSPGGVETYPAHVFPFSQGVEAVFSLSGFPANQAVTASVVDTTVTSVWGAPPFDLVNFTFNPAVQTTDGSGNLTLHVGATLRSDGGGALYNEGAYTGSYTLAIDYLAVHDTLTGTVNGTTVANTITMTQATAMTFGTIVVITDGSGGNLDAVMNNASAVTWPGTTGVGVNWRGAAGNGLGQGSLAPVTNPRIFPTGVTPAAAGRYDLSGGAPNASVGITYNNDAIGANSIPTTLINPTCAAVTLQVRSFTDNTAAGMISLDGAGAATVNVGATLRANNGLANNTNPTGTGTGALGGYCNGTYTGTLQVSALY